MYKIPKEYLSSEMAADEINAYNKGFQDGYYNHPYHDYPDFQRFDNLRCAYANGRNAGQLKRKEEVKNEMV